MNSESSIRLLGWWKREGEYEDGSKIQKGAKTVKSLVAGIIGHLMSVYYFDNGSVLVAMTKCLDVLG